MRLVRTILFFFVFSTIFISFYSCKNTVNLSKASCNEIWNGALGEQRVQFTHDAKNNIYLVMYPLSGCCGYWTLIESSPNKMKFVETIEITKKKDYMQNMVIVLDRVNSNEMVLSYYTPNEKKQENSGYLTKRN